MSLIQSLAALAGAAGAQFVRASRWSSPHIATHEFAIPDLGEAFDGYTIVAISDLHHAPARDSRWMRAIVDRANIIAPDLIALLGDYGTSFRSFPALSRTWYRIGLSAMATECARFRAGDGVVAVLGNHDYYAGAGPVHDWLHGFGADVLLNRARLIRRGCQTLRVAGMDDIGEGRLDPRAGCERGMEHPTIALSHNPDSVLHLARDVRVDLMVAGHTHGGQIVLPWYGAPLRMARVCRRRSASGWVDNSRTALYVMRGLGAQLPIPIRLNCPPEMLVLRLRAGGQHPA